jgi:hypothetical protein
MMVHQAGPHHIQVWRGSQLTLTTQLARLSGVVHTGGYECHSQLLTHQGHAAVYVNTRLPRPLVAHATPSTYTSTSQPL